MKRFLNALTAALAIGAAAAGQAHAADLDGTLKKISDTGVITIGHRETSIPFSYYDANQKPVGYSIDICARIVDAVKARIKRDDIQVKYLPVTSATRIPLMGNGTIDLECASTSNTLDRQKQVAFSVTTFVTGNRFISLKSANLKTIDDLKGQDGGLDLRHSQHPPGQRDQRGARPGHEGGAGQGTRRGFPDGGDRPRRRIHHG